MFADLLGNTPDFSVPSDIYAIGFEEIVDLNASNIVSARLGLMFTIRNQ